MAPRLFGSVKISMVVYFEEYYECPHFLNTFPEIKNIFRAKNKSLVFNETLVISMAAPR